MPSRSSIGPSNFDQSSPSVLISNRLRLKAHGGDGQPNSQNPGCFKQLKAWLIKFDERTPNPYFEHRQFATSRPPIIRIPHWAICEPFIREDIAKGDFLFFAPMQTFLVKGVLKVRMNASEEEAKQLLGNEWYSNHVEAVSRHSGVSRAGNITIGELSGSFWIDGGVDIRRFAFLPKTMFNPSRQAKFVPKFTNEEEVLNLYQELLTNWS